MSTANIQSVWGIANQRLEQTNLLLLADANIRSVPMDDALVGLTCALAERLAAVVLTRAELVGNPPDQAFLDAADLLARMGTELHAGRAPGISILG